MPKGNRQNDKPKDQKINKKTKNQEPKKHRNTRDAWRKDTLKQKEKIVEERRDEVGKERMKDESQKSKVKRRRTQKDNTTTSQPETRLVILHASFSLFYRILASLFPISLIPRQSAPKRSNAQTLAAIAPMAPIAPRAASHGRFSYPAKSCGRRGWVRLHVAIRPYLGGSPQPLLFFYLSPARSTSRTQRCRTVQNNEQLYSQQKSLDNLGTQRQHLQDPRDPKEHKRLSNPRWAHCYNTRAVPPMVPPIEVDCPLSRRSIARYSSMAPYTVRVGRFFGVFGGLEEGPLGVSMVPLWCLTGVKNLETILALPGFAVSTVSGVSGVSGVPWRRHSCPPPVPLSPCVLFPLFLFLARSRVCLFPSSFERHSADGAIG